MSDPRFLQLHTLHSYTAALLNRDDSGLAKRLPYGGTLRTRISSQCLKRHWRMADDPHSLHAITGAELSYRSRELVTKLVIDPLRTKVAAEILDALEPEFQKAVYGDKADKGKQSRQTLLFGAPEIRWLASEAERLATSSESPAAAKTAVAEWAKTFKDNIKVLRESATLPGGLTSALFGRMVTSDPAANIDAPVHVAHAFTVHAAETESDYFTAMDDLKEDAEDAGADTIQETELTSGLFYGYVVIDLPGLIANCSGDKTLAARVVHNLVYLIAEVSPGAKLGSTAPYERASLLLLEAGNRQPRSMAGAYRKAIAPNLESAVEKLGKHLVNLDATYATGEQRRYLTLADATLPGLEKGSLPDLAAWAAERVGEAI
ncbi:MAG: type I-E CRISPR-associated protein Cas7/Cse4/CasC [Acidobacteria bacterium]|nr:type I-E CRISPR-associated protein Cas7/Cse4/CasC [Acidobacteriota bacterium]